MHRSETDRRTGRGYWRCFSSFDLSWFRSVLATVVTPMDSREGGASTREESASMIQPLRKMHRAVFLILGIVLPVLFISGLVARHAPLSPSARTKEALKGSKVIGGTKFVMNAGSTMHKVRLIENTMSGIDREFELI